MDGKGKVEGRTTYSNSNAPAFPALLCGQAVRDTEIGAPVPAAYGDDAEFCDDDGGADGGGDFL